MVLDATKHLYPFDLEDGGSVLVSTLIEHPTSQQLNTRRADITQCDSEKYQSDKVRSDLFQSPDGERVRAYQGAR